MINYLYLPLLIIILTIIITSLKVEAFKMPPSGIVYPYYNKPSYSNYYNHGIYSKNKFNNYYQPNPNTLFID